MTFSQLQSNYRRNLPTELLDYQLPHIHYPSELDTEHNHHYSDRSDCVDRGTSHLLANIRKMNYS